MSGWETAAILSLFIASFLLIVITAVTLIRAWTGSNYKMAVIVLSLLMVANVAYFITCISSYEYLKAKKDSQDDASQIRFWANVKDVTLSFGDLFFCEGHWVLAHFYYKLAKNTPRVIA